MSDQQFNDPVLNDLMARISALESRGITLDDLPLGDLQRQLENNWQPDSAVLLQPYSITSDQLASQAVDKSNLATDALNAFLKLAVAADRKIAFGIASGTFSSGAFLSSMLVVPHGLGVVPAAAGPLGAAPAVGVPVCIAYKPQAADATNLYLQAQTWNQGATTGSVAIPWLAIG